MGVGFAPFPATNALQAYRVSVQNYLDRCATSLAALPTVAELPYNYFAHGEYNKPRKERQQTTVMVPRGGEFRESYRHMAVTFQSLQVQEEHRLKTTINQVGEELKRVDARIIKGNILAGEQEGRTMLYPGECVVINESYRFLDFNQRSWTTTSGHFFTGSRPNTIRVARRLLRQPNERIFVVADYGLVSESWEEMDDKGYVRRIGEAERPSLPDGGTA
jgi:hypothetical protein